MPPSHLQTSHSSIWHLLLRLVYISNSQLKKKQTVFDVYLLAERQKVIVLINCFPPSHRLGMTFGFSFSLFSVEEALYLQRNTFLLEKSNESSNQNRIILNQYTLLIVCTPSALISRKFRYQWYSYRTCFNCCADYQELIVCIF